MSLFDIGTFSKFLIKNQNLLKELIKKEFKVKYLGSYLGIIWGLLQPLVTILVFWFLFAIGFRTRPSGGNFPYILWLVSGIIPWFFINESITSGASSILDNSFLIKKVAFRVSILPLVRVLAALFVHLFFIIFMFLMFFIYRYPLTVYCFQIFYYLVAGIVLVTIISLITASITVFIKDMRQIVTIFMQFGFWLTAVFWPITILPAKFQIVIKLNPFSYIVEGFRNAMLYHHWFWENQFYQTLYFWGLTFILFIFGIMFYKKMRPYFADYV